MHYQYVVILKRDNEKHIDRISIFLCFISMLAFIFEQIRSAHFNFFLSFAALMIGAGVTINLISSRKKNARVRYKTWLLISGIFWIGMPSLQWLSIFFFVMAFMEYQAKYPLEIGFSDDQIVMNTLFKKIFRWQDLYNVVLKDGLLTMDFKNNRLFQKEAFEEEEMDADEAEFNAYCQRRLSSINSTPQ
jgi:hypothetical protein